MRASPDELTPAGRAPGGAEEESGREGPGRYFALAAILLATASSVIDASAVNVILPSVARTFAISSATAIHIVSAQQIILVALLLPCASLAEKFGFRRMLTTGIVLFVLSSIACFFASSFAQLIAARIAIGIAGACTFAATTALVRLSQPRHMLGQTMGIVATVVAVSIGLGPVVATAALEYADWTWIFVPNVVFGLGSLLLSPLLPVVRDRERRFNFVSATLTAFTFSLLILAVANIAERPTAALSCLACGLLLGLVLVRREWDRPFPILPIDLLRLPQFAVAVASAAFMFLAQMGAFVALPFHFLRDFDSIQTGLLLTAWPVAVALVAPCAGWLSDRFPAGLLCGAGAALLAAGLFTLASFSSVPFFVAAAALVVGGAGFGLFQTPNNRALLLAVPMNRVGAAGGMQAATRQFGQALGAASAALAFGLSAESGGTISLWIGVTAACAAVLINIGRSWRR
jgi:DHA2 family multidrug resistance protein-like MFS transporter